MRQMSSRLDRLQAAIPPPRPVRLHDLTRLTPDQRRRLAELSERYQAVGLEGLTDTELEEIAHLVGILEREESTPWPEQRLLDA